jgi:glycosyltransferase involved in cell wall biosynthesis
VNVLHKPRVVVAQIGARRHYAEARIFHESGMLEHFFTDAYIGNKPWMAAVLRALPETHLPHPVRRLLGRAEKTLPSGIITSFDLLGLRFVWAQRRARKLGVIENLYCEFATEFAKKIVKHGLPDMDVLLGFNGASLELFKYAKKKGIYCVLDQTSNPKPNEDRLTEEEYSRSRAWLPEGTRWTRQERFSSREREEWSVADTILAGSSFVRRGLVECGVPAQKIRVIPSGIDLTHFSPPIRTGFDGKRPLRVLFVGRVSIMKGIQYLLPALQLLGPSRVEAKLVGDLSIEPDKLSLFRDVATAVGAVPRTQIAEEYRWADVFCFPSITEGSASVVYEALASGLPVITTPNAGSIVKDGVNGVIVPIRDVAGLAEAIKRYCEDPILLRTHQCAAIAGREEAGIGRYSMDLRAFVQGLLA